MIFATPSSVQLMLFDEPTAIAGRFTVRNTAQAVETICGQISTELKQNRDGQSVGRLVAILERLTVVQLHDLKRSHNMKASGRTKAELVAKLATRLDRGRRADFSVSPVVELTAKQQEQALVQDLRAGRDGAFDRLYEQYSGLVRRDLCRRGVSATDAADVVQETFLRASQLLDTLNPEKSLGGFLKTIASRIAIDLNRKITRRGKVRTTSLDSVAEQTTQERDDWQAPEQSEQYTMVMTVLDEQPETTKEIVRLRFFEQLTFEQIAEQLGIGVTTAKDRVRKAIGAVQERVTVECCE
jgi:RNA polymerase sigma-70 factor (ECF subfamily)